MGYTQAGSGKGGGMRAHVRRDAAVAASGTGKVSARAGARPACWFPWELNKVPRGSIWKWEMVLSS